MLIGKKLSAENDSKSNADKYFKIFEDQLQPNRVSSQDVKKLRRLAWDFRFPGSWKLTRTYPTELARLAFSDGEEYVDFYKRGKTRIEERSVEELRNVFQENLNALKKALKTETPTEAQIKYFAQLVAATTRGLSFGDTFRQYDKQKLNEIAGGSDEIKTFLTAYKEATETIIVEEEKAAAAEKEAKQKK